MEGDHVGPFNLGNPGEFTMLELAQVNFTTFLYNDLSNFLNAFIMIFFFEINFYIYFQSIKLSKKSSNLLLLLFFFFFFGSGCARSYRPKCKNRV